MTVTPIRLPHALTAFLLCITFSLGGCAAFASQFFGSGKLTQNQVKPQVARKNMAALARMCRLQTAQGKRIDRYDPRAVKQACEELLNLALIQKKQPVVKGICDWRKMGHRNPTLNGIYRDVSRKACKAQRKILATQWRSELNGCKNYKTIYQTYSRAIVGKAQNKMRLAVAKQAAKCGDWTYIFEHMLRGRSKRNYHRFAKKGGLPMYNQVMRYLKTTRRPFEDKSVSRVDSLLSALGYIQDIGKATRCRPFVKLAKQHNDWRLDAYLKFFADVGCKEGAGLAVRRLGSRNKYQRRQACGVLGSIGSRKHVRKLKLIAMTDPAYRIRYARRDYFVRDACQRAITRIAMK